VVCCAHLDKVGSVPLPDVLCIIQDEHDRRIGQEYVQVLHARACAVRLHAHEAVAIGDWAVATAEASGVQTDYLHSINRDVLRHALMHSHAQGRQLYGS
jgi:hypothetical protein